MSTATDFFRNQGFYAHVSRGRTSLVGSYFAKLTFHLSGTTVVPDSVASERSLAASGAVVHCALLLILSGEVQGNYKNNVK